MSLERPSPCKVNLLLNILGRRVDGFHELETLLHPVRLCDHLAFDHQESGITLTCNVPELPTDAGNLVHRAASRFLDAARITGGVRIHLEKRIPLAAGLGGGSGNAAVTLLGLNELFDSPLTDEQVNTIAASLGSDVPFFLQDQPALATGRGEVITPLPPFPALRGYAFLLIHPGFGISTAWAYQQLAHFPEALRGRPGRAAELARRLGEDPRSTASAEFYNSLEAPALRKFPLLVLFQEFLRANGAAAALMSGSGSTTFALVPEGTPAAELEEKVRAKFGPCWTTVVPVTA